MARGSHDLGRAPVAVLLRAACAAAIGAACLLAARTGSASRDTLESHVLETRYGTVSWSSDAARNVPAKVFIDGVEVANFGSNDISIAADETLSDRRILLLDIEGGSVCPNSYMFLTLSQRRHTRTKLFGSCGAARVQRDGDEIEVETEGACKPILIDQDGGNEERWRACNEAAYRKFVYRHDTLELLIGEPQESGD